MNMWWLLSGIIIAVVIWLILRHIRAARQEQEDFAYGIAHGCEQAPRLPHKWPLALDLLLGAFTAAKNGTVFPFFFQQLSQLPNANTLEQVVLGESGFHTIDPENVEALLSTQFDDFDLGKRPPTFFPLLGDGIFTQDGPKWKHSRQMLRPLFSTNREESYHQIQEAVERMIEKINAESAVDLQPLFFNLTLETTVYLLLWKDINASDLKRNGSISAKGADFAKAFNVGQDYLSQRGLLGDYYWLIDPPGFRKACKTTHEYVDQLIAQHVCDTDERDEHGAEKRSHMSTGFIDTLLSGTENIEQARSQVLNLLLAGRDTTACCLTWALRLLTRNARVMSKLRHELSSVVGTDPPSQQDLKRMPYLAQVLKEVLRLYPSVPVNTRFAAKTTTLPVGGGKDGRKPLLIRKGTPIGYAPYIMHRRKDIFGEDADLFRPERWDGDFEKKVGWAYVPFNGGPRICLGQVFALVEASYAIVRLLQVFPSIQAVHADGKPVDESAQVPIGYEKQKLTLILSCAEGCWVKAGTR